jgi:hypothetical protein
MSGNTVLFMCWKQGHLALDFQLISYRDRREIAARKTAAIAHLREHPGRQDRTVTFAVSFGPI